MILLPMSKELNSDFLGNHRGAAQVLEDDHLAILTLALEDGSLTMSPSQQPKEHRIYVVAGQDAWRQD